MPTSSVCCAHGPETFILRIGLEGGQNQFSMSICVVRTVCITMTIANVIYVHLHVAGHGLRAIIDITKPCHGLDAAREY